MDIDQANLANLTGLWRKYGAQHLSPATQDNTAGIIANRQWPDRVWQSASMANTRLDSSPLEKANELNQWLSLLPASELASATIPVWPFAIEGSSLYVTEFEQQLEKLGLQCAFEQTAMYLPLQGVDTQAWISRNGFSVEQVQNSSQLSTWVSIASEAFGYDIDQQVVEKLIDDPSIQILLAVSAGEAVATALLYQDESVIGLHQIGVGKDFQGMGYARSMMHEMIRHCANKPVDYLVLQASQAGKPLYYSLGFKSQFAIRNYKKV